MNFYEPDYLRIHIEAATCWYAKGEDTPQTAPSWQDAVADAGGMPEAGIRVLGVQQNVPTIVSIAEAGYPMELASPLVCHSQAELRSPVIVLSRMRQCMRAASLGGWHSFDLRDYTTYRMAELILHREQPNPDTVEKMLQSHPVYRALSFLSPLFQLDAAKAVAYILDPRWYVDLQRPERLAKLRAFMGLSASRHLNQIHNDAVIHPNTKLDRCNSVMRAWGGASPVVDSRPGSFLMRRWAATGAGIRGKLRASSLFLNYLIYNWQNILVSNTANAPEMFLPDEMMQPWEAKAYRRHMAVAVGK